MIEQARLNKADRNLKRAQLISPFDGTVNDVYVEVGDYVRRVRRHLRLSKSINLI